MFAVLKTGGKQYTVRQGDVLRVEKLACEAGETIQFNDVLMVDGEVGAPFVAGAAVQATVIDQIKGEKVIHFVRRRRKHSSKRTKGHRQQLTLVRVTDILAAGADATGIKAAIGTGAKAVLVPVAAAVAAPNAPRRRKADAPATDALKAEAPKADAPATDAPKAAAPQTGAPTLIDAVLGAVLGTTPADAVPDAAPVAAPTQE